MGIVHMWYPDYDFTVFLDPAQPQTQLVLALVILTALVVWLKLKCQVTLNKLP